jgi:hypothetical protein
MSIVGITLNIAAYVKEHRETRSNQSLSLARVLSSTPLALIPRIPVHRGLAAEHGIITRAKVVR